MSSDNIEIILNGFKTKIASNTSIGQLLVLLNEGDLQVIVECNNQFVFPKNYFTTLIQDGDKIEMINPDFGG